MTKVPRVEVITSVERRRRWSRSEKERLVAASFEEGVTASDIAREAGIHVSQLFRWRKELCQAAAPERTALVPIKVVPVAPAPDPVDISRPARARVRRQAGTIEIDLASGARLRVDRDVDADALRRVLDVLGGR